MYFFHFHLNRYPREKHQGAAFERRIAAVDLILYFNCSDVSITNKHIDINNQFLTFKFTSYYDGDYLIAGNLNQTHINSGCCIGGKTRG